MGKPYKYRLRPGYGSGKLLLEFLLNSKDTEFNKDLFVTIESIHPKIETVTDLWMNDEVSLNISSDEGNFTLSKDIWDFVFIMAGHNQHCIRLIDEMLDQSPLFEKEHVKSENYRIRKN